MKHRTDVCEISILCPHADKVTLSSEVRGRPQSEASRPSDLLESNCSAKQSDTVIEEIKQGGYFTLLVVTVRSISLPPLLKMYVRFFNHKNDNNNIHEKFIVMVRTSPPKNVMNLLEIHLCPAVKLLCLLCVCVCVCSRGSTTTKSRSLRHFQRLITTECESVFMCVFLCSICVGGSERGVAQCATGCVGPLTRCGPPLWARTVNVSRGCLGCLEAR